MAKIDDVFFNYRDKPLNESIGAVVRALAEGELFVPLGEEMEAGKPSMLLTGKDKQQRLWAYAYTSAEEFSKALPQGGKSAGTTIGGLIISLERNEHIFGVLINSGGGGGYPIFRSMFDLAKEALGLPVGDAKGGSRADGSGEHDRLFKTASALIWPLISIHGRGEVKIGAKESSELKRGMELLDRVLELNPRNWSAMWIRGKVYQRLAEFNRAFEWFERADQANPGHADVLREASIAAMEMGEPAKAIPFCQRAIEAKPEDPGLRANLALALLFSGSAQEALDAASEASTRDPGDKITRRIVALCKSVISGKRPCPRHQREI